MISGTFYTKTEVSQMLGCDMKTLYRWMKAGKFTYQKLGSAVLIPEDEVKRLQEEQTAIVLSQKA